MFSVSIVLDALLFSCALRLSISGTFHELLVELHLVVRVIGAALSAIGVS